MIGLITGIGSRVLGFGFGLFTNRPKIGIIIMMGLALGILWYMSKSRGAKVDELQLQIQEMKQDMRAMKEAAILTEQLRKDNAKLTNRVTVVRKEIHAAPNANQPLPPDILSIVRSVQQTAPKTGPGSSP